MLSQNSDDNNNNNNLYEKTLYQIKLNKKLSILINTYYTTKVYNKEE